MNLITENAGQDDHAGDYLDMLAELRQTYSLRELVDVMKSDYSIGAWGRYQSGERELPRDAKNELRALLKLPLLPPTIEEAMKVVDPNAQVYQEGHQEPDMVIMGGSADMRRLLNVPPVPAGTGQKNQGRKPAAPQYLFEMEDRQLAWNIRNRFDYEVAE